ncbi:MAG: tRNA (adenosine(37)-N6)-threonylcarbamoyltransferase complex dimerization subunit type 1 TsaB [Saprospiraceae bacterium]|nr:tRNA (adenosine(37)-N6)-threonylcarbamoyltransferase complex dimerization subunit type 1 TsaB [Saprospiraceae bacterium]
MAKILLIETATEVCSVAIAVEGVVVALAEASESPSHSALLTMQISQCVRESGIELAELDAVAVSNGPGSYTSLRVGVSVAKGICYALNKPLIAVDTLGSLALASKPVAAQDGGRIYFLPMIDARRNEVWTSVYTSALERVNLPQPLILENNSFIEYVTSCIDPDSQDTLIVSGNGSQKIADVTLFENTVVSPIKKCSAQYLSELAFYQFQNNDFQDIAYFEPLYMKPPNITVSNKSAWHEK